MQAMEELLAGILEGECRDNEESLAETHRPQESSSAPWEPSVGPERRACRTSVTDNATASWAATADCCTNFCSHEQSSFGYGLCMAVTTAPSLEVTCATTAECVAAHLEGKPTETSKLVSTTVCEVVGKNIARFVVCPPYTAFVFALVHSVLLRQPDSRGATS
jgi:hypothetical protein